MTTNYEESLKRFRPTPKELTAFAASPQARRLQSAFERLLIWRGFLDRVRPNVEARVLLAAAHSKAVEIWVLIPFGLEHSAYASLRSLMDAVVAYTYYHTHPVEWAAVCHNDAQWESRTDVVAFHIRFTPRFREFNKEFGLGNRMSQDYRQLSRFVHCIAPHGLPSLTKLGRHTIPSQRLESFLDLAERTCSLLNLLLIAVFHEHLSEMAGEDYRVVMKAVPAGKLRKCDISLRYTNDSGFTRALAHATIRRNLSNCLLYEATSNFVPIIKAHDSQNALLSCFITKVMKRCPSRCCEPKRVMYNSFLVGPHCLH